MKELYLGVNKTTKEPVGINLSTVINHHGIIFGASGSGKTYTIRGLAKGLAMAKKGNKCIIFDVHGDILSESPLVSTVSISETSDAGLQPFKINPNENYGGVNRTISRFIYSVNSSTQKLGITQESVLKNLLKDMLSHFGFEANDPKTWSLSYDPREKPPFPKRYPTYNDLLYFARRKQEEVFLGADKDVIREFNAFAKKSRSFSLKVAKEEFGESEEAFNEAKDSLLATFEEFLDSYGSQVTGDIIQDQLKYKSVDVVNSVINRLESLYDSGVFKDGEIRFDHRKPIHRYDLSTLSTDAQKTFINMAMSNLYLELRERGHGVPTDTFVFIDEAKNYIDDSDDNMIMKFFNEIRKYGCGVWLGGQQIGHFTDDIIASAGTKLILGIDRMDAKAFANKLKIDIDIINGIAPKKTFLAEIKESGKGSGFIVIEI